MADETAAGDESPQEPAGSGPGDESPQEPVEEAPRDERREEILGRFTEVMGDAVVGSHIDPGRDLWVRVSTGAWGEVAGALRGQMGCKYFGFLSAIDWLPSPYGRSMDSEVDNVLGTGEEPGDDSGGEDSGEGAMQQGVAGGETRFQMFARVADVSTPGGMWGMTVKADVADDDLRMPTWTGVYAGADWHERECWEMYGIEFVGHPGMRHIYLPSDFEGNPLRKDYPLVARMVKPWPGIVDVEALPEDDQVSAGSDGPAGSQDAQGSP